MTLQTNWYVITGGPSSGKSTVIRALQDKGYKTTLEAARHYIDLQRMNGPRLKKFDYIKDSFNIRY